MASNTELELPENPSQRCNFVVRWAPGYGLRERAGRPPKGWDISYYPHLQRRITRDCEFMCSQHDSISIISVHGWVIGELRVICSRDGDDRTILSSGFCSSLPGAFQLLRLKIAKAKAVHILTDGQAIHKLTDGCWSWQYLEGYADYEAKMDMVFASYFGEYNCKEWDSPRVRSAKAQAIHYLTNSLGGDGGFGSGAGWDPDIDKLFVSRLCDSIGGESDSYLNSLGPSRWTANDKGRQECSLNYDNHRVLHYMMKLWKLLLTIEDLLLDFCQLACLSIIYDRKPRPGRPKHIQTMTMPWSICTALAVIWGVCWMFYGPQMPGFNDFGGSNPFFQELSAQDMFVWLPDGSIDNLSFNPAPSPQPMMWPDGVPGHTSNGFFTESQPSRAPDMLLLEQGSFVNAEGGRAGSAPVPGLLPTTATTGPPNSQGPARQISNPENMFRCNHGSCTSAFPTRGRLRAHEKRHTRAWKCLTCNTSFGAPKDLARHKSTVHQHSNPFKCEILDCPRYHKPFSRQDNLKRHMRVSHGQDQLPYLEVSQGSGSEARSHTHSGDQAGSTPNSMNDKGKSIAEYDRAYSPEQSSIQSIPENGLDQEVVPGNDKEHVPAAEKLGDQIENLKKQVAMLKEENWKLKEENSQQAEQVRKLSTAIKALI
ncbi:putative C2H2-type domain-containing protein [Seiridium cardinale]